MRFIKTLVVAVVALGAMTALHAQGLEAELQRVIQREIATGDLKAAIQDYERIVARAGANHAVAAEALLRMADDYQKLGDNQARATYQRVIQQYSDQPDAVARARARLGASGAISHTQVWTGPKVDAGGTISPDGRYLSFTNWDTGNLELHDFATGVDRPLTRGGTWTGPDKEWAETSAISRDGMQVAYSWFNKDDRYELRVTSLRAAAGGVSTPRRLVVDDPTVVDVEPKDWSPDGRLLAVNISRGKLNFAFGVVDSRSGQLTVLKETTRWGTLKFSPDGRFLAFDVSSQRAARAPRDVWIMSLASREAAPLVEGPQSDDGLLGWSSDGKWLVFESDRRGSADVWAVGFAVGRPAGQPTMLKNGVGGATLGITASGALFLNVASSERDISIAAIDPATGKPTTAPVKAVDRFQGTNRQPDWSPDSARLAYMSVRPQGDVVLGIRTLATDAVVEHHLAVNMIQVPRWAPDGRSFIAQGTDKERKQGIFRIDAATGVVTPIAAAAAGEVLGDPQWHPDGRHIYYLQHISGSGQGGLDAVVAVVERDLTTGATRQIVRKPGLTGLDLDRTGGTLVAVWRDAASSAYVVAAVPVDGSNPRELDRFGEGVRVAGRGISWTPDGTAVLVNTVTDDGTALVVVSTAGAARRTLQLGSKVDIRGAVRVRPDGRAIAYDDADMREEVWKLEHFLPQPSGR